MEFKYKYFKSDFTGQVYKVRADLAPKYSGYKEVSEEEYKKYYAEFIKVGEHIYHDLEKK